MKKSLMTDQMVMWFFGTLIGLMIVVFFVIPAYSQVIYGRCWSNSVKTAEAISTEAGSLYTQTSNLRKVAQTEFTVALGPCVSVIGVLSDREIRSKKEHRVFRELCKGSSSYVIAMPHLSQYKEGVWQKIVHPIDTIKTFGVKTYEWFKDKFHLLNKPACIPLVDGCRDCEISEELFLTGPEGDEPAEYCIRVTVNGKTVTVEQIGAGPC
jgi:hypothetical protein